MLGERIDMPELQQASFLVLIVPTELALHESAIFLVDFVDTDVSGEATRKKPVFGRDIAQTQDVMGLATFSRGAFPLVLDLLQSDDPRV